VNRAAVYSFRRPKSLAEIFAAFNRVGPWRWSERDSERFGDYMSSSVLTAPDHGMVKLFVEPYHYALNIVLEADDRAKLDAVYDTLFTLLLPLIGATDIKEEPDLYE
jgi:hypothetical protein